MSALIDLGSLATYVNEKRDYIGASGIGNPCNAYQALCLRGFSSDYPSPKTIRIFRDGKRIEDQVVSDMEAAGIAVAPIDAATGKQYRYTDFSGCMSASLDGYVILAGHKAMTLEIKSMNKAMFSKFVSKGLAVSHPHYVDQIQAGLGLARGSGIDVDAGLMVAYCKDNSEYHAEIIEFDSSRYDEQRKRVMGILSGLLRPVRISAYQAAHQCSGCFKRSACWSQSHAEDAPTCKHCQYAETNSAGQWQCTTGGQFGVVCGSFKQFRVVPSGR